MKLFLKFKRGWALLLSLVLVVGMMPVTASAETLINEIHITSSTTSVSPGVLPPYTASTTTPHVIEVSDFDWAYWVEGYTFWWSFNDETPIAVEDGITHYGLDMYVRLEEGYALSDDPTIYFNGVDVTHVGHTKKDVFRIGIDLGTAGKEIPTYSVAYRPNGGTGTMDPSSAREGNSVMLRSCTFTPPAGKLFKAWEIDGTEYADGADYILKGNVTAKAIWKEDNYIRESRATMIPGKISSAVCPNDLKFISAEPDKYTVAFFRVYDLTDQSLNTGGTDKRQYPYDKAFICDHEYAIECKFTAVSPYEYDELHSGTGSLFYLNGTLTEYSPATPLGYSCLRRICQVVPDMQYLIGDVDGNGKVTTTDARLTLQYSAKKIGSEALELLAADVNSDGIVTTTDARLILQKAAGKIAFFP